MAEFPAEQMTEDSFRSAGDDPVLACSLDGSDHRERVARWNTVLASAVIARRPLGVAAGLPVGAANDVVVLITAEQQCCPFLGVDITFVGSTVELRITAPSEDALPYVDALLPAPVR